MFWDVSNVTNGGVLYVCFLFSKSVEINLNRYKSRIIPINNKLTTPKLDLNSAFLVSFVAEKLPSKIKDIINDIILFSDSLITISLDKI